MLLMHAAILLLAARPGQPARLVRAPVGSVRGVPARDGDYIMFLGVPYARVNLSNPFGASIPYEKFEKTFEANAESPVCPQFKEVDGGGGRARYAGDLDCLRLNIFVPKSDTEDLKAVYMFVFGGKFSRGHSEIGTYGPRYLVRQDIIVVIFNFRIGPYGFMCTDIPEVPGNQGLRDQYDAIEWIRVNIRAFGGDPRRITLGGHSSGSMLVDMHLLTARPRLFRRAILQSGTATSPDFFTTFNTTILVDVAKDLGFETDDAYAALAFLNIASPEALIEATEGNGYEWRPCIEKQFEGVVPYIVENPELSEGANVDGMDILGGFANREATYTLYSPSYSKMFSRPDAVRAILDLKFNIHNASHLVDIVRHFYLDDDGDRETAKYQIVDLLSDFNFIYPVQRQLIEYSKRRGTTVYLYMFSYDGGRNRMKITYNMPEAGATHSDELGYMFAMDLIPEPPSREDQRIIDQITTLWANFVKYGNPTPARTALLPVTWPALGAAAVPCLQLGADVSVVARPVQRNMAFWDLFYDAHLDKLKYTRTNMTRN